MNAVATVPVNRSAPFYGLVVEIDEAFQQVNIPIRQWLRDDRVPTVVRPRVPSSRAVAKSEYPEPPGDWIVDAACKGRRMFYTVIQAHITKISRDEQVWERESLAVCQTCPVLNDCRMWALQDVDPAVDHIAGGLTPRQRRMMRRGHPQSSTPQP